MRPPNGTRQLELFPRSLAEALNDRRGCLGFFDSMHGYDCAYDTTIGCNQCLFGSGSRDPRQPRYKKAKP